jgi:hypothetical protein
VSLLDELGASEDTGPQTSAPGGVLDDLTGRSRDGDIDKADEETQEAAKQQLGEAALVAFKGNDPRAIYQAILDIISNEG